MSDDDSLVQYNWDAGWMCNLCSSPLDSVEVLDHMRSHHPDIDVDPEPGRWAG